MLQQSDLEKLGVQHVGERVLLMSLAKAYESMWVWFSTSRKGSVYCFYYRRSSIYETKQY